MNTKKTKVMFQWSGELPIEDPVKKIDGAELRTVTQFAYLRSIVSTDRTADVEAN